ncbi:MAG: UbiA family prenyltransferase [Saprospiraceae bacterium]
MIAFVQVIFYGNYWIALAALCMTCQTQYLLTGHFEVGSPAALFLFFGTLFIYSVHRLYGLYALNLPKDSLYGKFAFLLKINTGFAAVAGSVCWFQLPEAARWQALAPCALALAYILPVLPGRRRLREVAMLKIFLLAICWAWLTVIVPAVAGGMGWSVVAPIMLLERAAFIFAIALGFDLRDRQRDQEAGLATLPVKFGERASVLCAAVSLLFAWGIAWLFTSANVYPTAAFYSTGVSGFCAMVLISRSGRNSLSPYCFLFGLDGLMILQFLLIIL